MLQSLQARRINKPDAKVLRLPDIQTLCPANLLPRTHKDALSASTTSGVSGVLSSTLPTPISIQSSVSGFSPLAPLDADHSSAFHQVVSISLPPEQASTNNFHGDKDSKEQHSSDVSNTSVTQHLDDGDRFDEQPNCPVESESSRPQSVHVVIGGMAAIGGNSITTQQLSSERSNAIESDALDGLAELPDIGRSQSSVADSPQSLRVRSSIDGRIGDQIAGRGIGGMAMNAESPDTHNCHDAYSHYENDLGQGGKDMEDTPTLDALPADQVLHPMPAPSPENIEAETRRHLKRTHALRELVATEENYVEELDSLVNVFIRVLSQCSWFPEALHRRLENVMMEMLRVQQQFLALIALPTPLKDSSESYHPAIATRYIRHISSSFEELSHSCHLYGGFCDVREKTLRQINKVVSSSTYITFQNKCKERFLLRQQERHATQMSSTSIPRLKDIKDFLIKPIQRICRYPLLVQELIRLTKETDEEFKDLTNMLVVAKAMAAHVDEAQKLYERRQKTDKFIDNVPEVSTPRKASQYANIHCSYPCYCERGSGSNPQFSTGGKHILEQRRSSLGHTPSFMRTSISVGVTESGAIACQHSFANSCEGINADGSQASIPVVPTESMLPKTSNATTPTLLAPNEVVYPSSLTRTYLKTLGPLLMLNVLEVYHLNNLPVRSKIYGCVIFETMLIMISPKKANAFEPRHWLPLRLLEIDELDVAVDDTVTHSALFHHLDERRNFCWRLTFGDHIFLLSALNAEEKAIWVTVLRTQIEAAKRNAEHLRTLVSNRDSNTASVAVLSQIYQGIHEKTVSSLPWNTPGSSKTYAFHGNCNGGGCHNHISTGICTIKNTKSGSKCSGGNCAGSMTGGHGIRHGSFSLSSSLPCVMPSSSAEPSLVSSSTWSPLGGGGSRAASRLSTVTTASGTLAATPGCDGEDAKEEDESEKVHGSTTTTSDSVETTLAHLAKGTSHEASAASHDDQLHQRKRFSLLDGQSQTHLCEDSHVCTTLEMTRSRTSSSEGSPSALTIENKAKFKRASQDIKLLSSSNSGSTPALQGSSSLTSLRPGSPLPRIFSERRQRSNSDVARNSSIGSSGSSNTGNTSSQGSLLTSSRESKIIMVRNLLKGVTTQCTWDIPASLSAASSPSLSRSNSRSSPFLPTHITTVAGAVGTPGCSNGLSAIHTSPGIYTSEFMAPMLSPLSAHHYPGASFMEYGGEDVEESTSSMLTQSSSGQAHSTFNTSSLTNRLLRRRDSGGKGSIMTRTLFSSNNHHHHHGASVENQRDHRPNNIARSGSDSNMGSTSSSTSPSTRRLSATSALAATLSLKKLTHFSHSFTPTITTAAAAADKTPVIRRSSHHEANHNRSSSSTKASVPSNTGYLAGKRSISFHEHSLTSCISPSQISAAVTSALGHHQEQQHVNHSAEVEGSEETSVPPVDTEDNQTMPPEEPPNTEGVAALVAATAGLEGFSQDTIESLQSAAIMARTRRTTNSSDGALGSSAVARTRESSVSSVLAGTAGIGLASGSSQPGTPRVLARNSLVMINSPPITTTGRDSVLWDVPISMTSPKALARSWHVDSGLAALQQYQASPIVAGQHSRQLSLSFQPLEVQSNQQHRESGIERMWHAMGRTFGGGRHSGVAGQSIASGSSSLNYTLSNSNTSAETNNGGCAAGSSRLTPSKKRFSGALNLIHHHDSHTSSAHPISNEGAQSHSQNLGYRHSTSVSSNIGLFSASMAAASGAQMQVENRILARAQQPLLVADELTVYAPAVDEEATIRANNDTSSSLASMVPTSQPTNLPYMIQRRESVDQTLSDTNDADNGSILGIREGAQGHGQKGKGKSEWRAAHALSMTIPTASITGAAMATTSGAPPTPTKAKPRSIINTAFKTLIGGGFGGHKKKHKTRTCSFSSSTPSYATRMDACRSYHTSSSNIDGSHFTQECLHEDPMMDDANLSLTPALESISRVPSNSASELTSELAMGQPQEAREEKRGEEVVEKDKEQAEDGSVGDLESAVTELCTDVHTANSVSQENISEEDQSEEMDNKEHKQEHGQEGIVT
ncbi:T-lymphoma invasion and metastasis-inducing protein 2 [Actinomortierella wolfii]|nr:T-lymphoma invasion and metastasis-inducing protein 2 [Actinomortierella wolfii]